MGCCRAGQVAAFALGKLLRIRVHIHRSRAVFRRPPAFRFHVLVDSNDIKQRETDRGLARARFAPCEPFQCSQKSDIKRSFGTTAARPAVNDSWSRTSPARPGPVRPGSDHPGYGHRRRGRYANTRRGRSCDDADINCRLAASKTTDCYK